MCLFRGLAMGQDGSWTTFLALKHLFWGGHRTVYGFDVYGFDHVHFLPHCPSHVRPHSVHISTIPWDINDYIFLPLYNAATWQCFLGKPWSNS